MGDLQETQAQLSMIESALAADPDNQELIQLKSDLQTLISLTKQSLEASFQQKGSEEDPIFCDDDVEVTHEVIQIEEEKTSDDSDEKKLEEELKNLEGTKVSAPYSTEYRGRSFHNAVIFSVEPHESENFEDIHVKVVFSHPTETGMMPCKHFLHGKCNRDDESCKWSHGERVSLAELREWEEGDWSKIKKESIVLTQLETGTWARARVQDFEGDDLILKLEGSNLPPVTCKLEQVFPLPGQDDDSDVDDDVDGDLKDDHQDDDNTEYPEMETFTPVVINPATSGRLGEWEDFTRGIASKLMSKMGWSGGGLGKDSEGRLEPVPVSIYPQGKSLDWCMERKELVANGEDVGNVEKILKKKAKDEARKSELRARKEHERDNSAKSLFDFINVKLGGKKANISDMFGTRGGGGGPSSGKNTEKTTLKSASNEKLKVENFKIGEKIRATEREISRLEESFSRHSGKDARTAAGIRNKINEKKQELSRLQSNERRLAAEQGNRKSSSKLTIF